MRNITLIACATLLAVPLHAQVIFQSGFEEWDGGLPTDWVGARTNLALSGIQEVTDNVFEGNSAVRLVRDTQGHQRFTTQPLTVVDGQAYNVTFQVRGEGQIRLGLYDGRPTGSGYATYSPYENITGNNWTEVSLTITAAMNTSDAEFILSLQNTVAPEHLVVDDVTITIATVEPPLEASIQEIQESTAPDGASPLVGQVVSTGGVVTALLANGFFLQNGGGPWSGIFVFSTQNTPAIGDLVSFTATVEEFFGMTQLTQVNDFAIASSGNMLDVTSASTADVNTEPFEAVLVQVSNATCTNPDAGFGQFVVNDGSGDCLVDDVIFQFTASLGATYNVTGPVQYAFEQYKILPRDINDVELVTGMDDLAFGGVELFPNPATDVLNIHLGRMEGRTEYTLADATGRVVRGEVITHEQGVIPVYGLASGSYVLTLRSGDSVWSTRVMVSR